MSRNTDISNVSRRLFLTVAGGAAAANSFAVGESINSTLTPHTTSTNYVLTIDVTTDPISYLYTDASGKKHKANRHPVKGTDTVAWQVTTPAAIANPPKPQAYHVTIFFMRETPLVDSNNNPVFAIHGSETSNPSANIDADAVGTYEYYVTVTDDITGKTYADDPKIIVGGGGTLEQAELIENANLLIEETHKLEGAAGSDRVLKEKLQDIEKNLREVVHSLGG